MSTNAKTQMASGEGSRPSSAEQRLKELGIKLPAPPWPVRPADEPAAAAAGRGRGPVLLVDADPQGSTAEWYEVDPLEDFCGRVRRRS